MPRPYVDREYIPVGHRSQVSPPVGLPGARARVYAGHLDTHELIEVEHGLVHVLAAGPELEALVKDGRARVVCAALRGIVLWIVVLAASLVSTTSHDSLDRDSRAWEEWIERSERGRGERRTFGMQVVARCNGGALKRESRSNLPEIAHAPRARESRSCIQSRRVAFPSRALALDALFPCNGTSGALSVRAISILVSLHLPRRCFISLRSILN